MTVGKNNLINVSKAFEAPVADVYALCADEDFFDFCGVDIDSGDYEFRVGGAYAYEVDETDFVKGEFREITPGSRIVFTWSTMGLDGPTGASVVTLNFKGDASSCVVDLEHSGLAHRPTAEAHAEAWTEILEAIAEELAER